MIQTPPTTSAKKWTFETAILQLEYRLQSDHLATLEAAVKEYQEGDPAWDLVRNLNKQIDTLTAENKRLREALSKILNSPRGEGIHLEGRIAQAALRGAKEFLKEK